MAAPPYPPINACELEVGRPRYHVIKFHMIAPSNPQAPTVDSGWQAGTCKKEPAITDGNPADFCNVESNPGEYFFEDASAHPNYGFTQFIVAHHSEEVLLGQVLEQPSNELAYVRVELPVGLAVNPGATGRCQDRRAISGQPSHRRRARQSDRRR